MKPRTEVVAEIVSAYLSHNTLPATEVSFLIKSVERALGFERELPAIMRQPLPRKPTAEEVQRSIKPGALISFIDGKPYKTLKRHLRTYGFTPETYRQRYGLPADYPMACAKYPESRSETAKGSRDPQPQFWPA